MLDVASKYLPFGLFHSMGIDVHDGSDSNLDSPDEIQSAKQKRAAPMCAQDCAFLKRDTFLIKFHIFYCTRIFPSFGVFYMQYLLYKPWDQTHWFL